MILYYRLSVGLGLAVVFLGPVLLATRDFDHGFEAIGWVAVYYLFGSLAAIHGLVVSLIASFADPPLPSAKWMAGLFGLILVLSGLSLLIP